MQMLARKNQPKKFGLVKKPWGGYLILEKRPDYWLKKLFVKKGEKLSLQSHKERDEIWMVLKGKIDALKGNEHFILKEGELIKIRKREKHRIAGIAKNSCVLEVAFGHPRERDIVRHEDKYGRIK